MELLDYKIEIPHWKTPITIHGIGDIHRAALGCDSKQLRSDINQIKVASEKGEHHYWLGMGDWSNGIGPKDKRHDATAVAPEFAPFVGDNLFGQEALTLAQEFKPIKHLGIGMLMGNHESAVAKYNQYNPATDIAERLDIPFLGYSALVRLRVCAPEHVTSIVVFVHHGTGAASTKGGKVNMLFKMRSVVDADIYMVGHVHEIIDWPEAVLSVNRRGALQLHERELLFINSGTYLKAYSTENKAQDQGKFNDDRLVHTDYAEVKAYRPAVIGHNGFQIQMARKKTRGRDKWGRLLKRMDFRR